MQGRSGGNSELKVRFEPKVGREEGRRGDGSENPTACAIRRFIIPGCHVMNVTLLKALVVLVPASMLCSWSAVVFLRGKTLCSLLQLLGAGCLVVVGLTHVSEALQLLPWMYWGSPDSVGHYLDFVSAGLGLTLFPVGYLCRVLTKR